MMFCKSKLTEHEICFANKLKYNCNEFLNVYMCTSKRKKLYFTCIML